MGGCRRQELISTPNFEEQLYGHCSINLFKVYRKMVSSQFRLKIHVNLLISEYISYPDTVKINVSKIGLPFFRL